MSRKDVKSDNRCPVCGGRMRLVNVTWVDTFQTPEASQYDLSVSRRNALLKKTPVSSSQEMMCASCSRRMPLDKEALKKAKKENKKSNKKDNKKNNKKNRGGSVIGWLIFLVILAVVAYFAYTYRDMLGGYVDKAVELFNKAKEFIGKFQK